MVKKLKLFSLIAMFGFLTVAPSACASSQPDKRIVRGNPAASVTVIEYTEFQCPYCAFGARTLSAVMARYEGKVNLVVRHYPLSFHPVALPAALYFEALAGQSPEKAWQFYDALFADSRQLLGGEEALKLLAAGLGADMNKLEQDVRSAATYKKIAADKQAFEQAGFDGVPVFVIGKTVLIGAQPPEKFIEAIEAALKK